MGWREKSHRYMVPRLVLGMLVGMSVAPLLADEDATGLGQAPCVEVRPAARVVPPAIPGAWEHGRTVDLEFIPTGVDPEGDTPTEMAFTPDGLKIVIAHRDSQNLVVFDADTRDVLMTIPLSGSPNSLAITSDGQHAVTANIFEDTMSIVALSTGVETDVVTVGDQPGTVRLSPDGSLAVVGNTLDSDLSVVDIASATELKQLAGAEFTQLTSWGTFAITYRFTDYVIALDSNTVIFPDMYGNQLVFFDIAAGTANTVASQPGPFGIAMSSDGTTVVVSHNYPESRVSVVDVATQTITKSISTGASATSVPPVAMNPAKTKAVVAVQNAVRVVDLISDSVSGDLSTGGVNGLATTADGLYCVVCNYQGSLVSYGSESIVANLLYTTTPDLLAASPVDARAATGHALRKEFLEVMNVNGASGYLEEVVPTGPPPEGDKARDVAITPDGSKAVMINNHSHNATIIDLHTGSFYASAAVGERPGEVAVTPDGTTAVVANLDSSFATVIDLASGTPTDISISRRGGQVEISPDGTYAYIAVVADGDGVWRINLNTMSVEGPKVLTGNMTGIYMMFDNMSGMTLSHDGATLVCCGSYDDKISIIATASWSEVARLDGGDFPVRAAFSADDAMIYITNRDDDTVTVVQNAGGSSTIVDTINVGDRPYVLSPNPAGTKLYVANYGGKSISVIDLPANVVTNTIPIPETNGAGEPAGLYVSADGGRLFVAANGADFHVIDTSTETIVDTINTGLAPAELEVNELIRRAFMPSPLGSDGLSIVYYGVVGDVDQDGDVDLSDLAALLGAYGTCLGGPAYDYGADIDNSGCVDLSDLAALLGNYGYTP